MGKAGTEEVFSDQFVELIERDRRWVWVGLLCGVAQVGSTRWDGEQE